MWPEASACSDGAESTFLFTEILAQSLLAKQIRWQSSEKNERNNWLSAKFDNLPAKYAFQLALNSPKASKRLWRVFATDICT